MRYIVDFSYMMKKFQSTGFSYKHKLGAMEYEAGYTVQMVSAFRKILEENPGVTIYLCLDGTPIRNRTLMPEYKMYRTPVSVDQYPVSAFLPTIRKQFPQINILFLPGEEADIVAASLVCLLKGAVTAEEIRIGLFNLIDISKDLKLTCELDGFEYEKLKVEPTKENIILCTSDADWYQLLAFPKVYTDKSLSLTKVDPERRTPKTVGEVAPHQITAYKSLKGDASDKLPGLKLKGFKVMDYIKGLEHSNQYESELFAAGPSASELGRLLWKTRQWQQAYVNYLMAKLEFTSTPLVVK